jgi:multidrug transporter EmrE-like cation transporter
MSSVTVRSVALLLGVLAGQLTAIGLLPKTNGFTVPAQTIACIAAFVFSLWMIARLLQGGAGLGILIPFLNAIIPLGAMALGAFIYGESASPLKIAMLISACALIGVASRFH